MRSRAELTAGLPAGARRRLEEVALFGEKNLEGLRRRSGETYAENGRNVAVILREISNDPELLSVAVLHDLLVHPRGKDILREAPLSPRQRRLVRSMHDLRGLRIDRRTADLDRVIEAFIAEADLLPLRMAHRLNDVRRLKHFSPAVRKSIARETLHMYAPIAGRLGMTAWRREMEDRCFPVLQPESAHTIRQLFSRREKADRLCLELAERFLARKCKEAGISASFEARMKGHFSAYRKMALKRRSFDELTDRLALRVIVPRLEDCYRVLGVVHASFHPMPGKLKDYIGAPKENGYQSIHTVVYPLPDVSDSPIEIQIRTGAMDRACEWGIAAHHEYKRRLYGLTDAESRVDLLRNFRQLREEALTPGQFEEALRQYFREDLLSVFDQRGKLHHLQTPATALDFALRISGKKCAELQEILVNGRARPLGTPLKNGDTVGAVFGSQCRLDSRWLRHCQYESSKALIRSLLPTKSGRRQVQSVRGPDRPNVPTFGQPDKGLAGTGG